MIMGIFDKLFKRKWNEKAGGENSQPEQASEKSQKVIRFLEYYNFMNILLQEKDYISRKRYSLKMEKYADTIHFFKVLSESKMLDAYCNQNGISVDCVVKGLEWNENILAVMDKHNECYIMNAMEQEKQYLDTILHDVDPKIMLDEDQRRVILTDEDYCLVIAGAGAGKTTTVAAKVKYLVEKRGVDPKQILVVSFTNKAVQELKDKINKNLDIECPISTFHSVGNAIIHKNSPEEKLNIARESQLYFTVRDYFRESIMKNERMVNKLILFFASYFDAPFEGKDLNSFFNNIAKSNFSTMRSELEDFKREVIDARTKKAVTIQNEILRSYQEVEIANFLYLNGIDYEYEPLYQYDIPGARKPYTPDFIIRQGDLVAYIEHFGINEDGTNYVYSDNQLEAYKKAINDKIRLHRQHQTILLYTFSSYKDGKPITVHLQEQLGKYGFKLMPRSNKEIMEKLVTGEGNRYIRRLVSLICRFISNFKVNGFTTDDFSRMYHSTQNVRTRLFLDICNDCYVEYERYLKENHAVDFQDMINESARILREVKDMKQKLDFKYIIVDEYQDISRQRFDLTKAFSDITDAKIIAVGDDWQSIYAFSGSDITLFTRFESVMGYAKLLKIVKTYRNSQEVIDIAGNFIQKNTEQISKTLLSPKNITDPVIIYTYDATYKKVNANRRTGANYAWAHVVETALDQIVEYAIHEKKNIGTVLLLGRFGFDGDHLERSGLFEYVNRGSKIKSVKYPQINITYMTAHASKGLGYDNVIIVNGRNETYGFPAKIEDDPVLAFVIKGDRSIDYAEERRLFYVAMTRTKNRVFIVAPEQNPSEFLLEIKRDYKNVILRGNWNEDEPQNITRKSCPICGFPLQLRYKNAYGLRLYMCTNEPEICDFMTNEYKAGKMSIMKCSSCRDGYLIIKPGKNHDYFLGCTNYKQDGSGCNNVISQQQYYKNMGFELEKEILSGDINEKNRDTSDSNKKQPFVPNKSDGIVAILKPDIESVWYKNCDLNEMVFTILMALQHISEIRYYGVNMMLDVLRGASSERLHQANLQSISEYGALKEFSREEITLVIEWILENHLMLKTKGKYPVLHPTAEGNNYHETITAGKLKGLKKCLESQMS